MHYRKGALSFGLVLIPVRMHSASLERELQFKMLYKKTFQKLLGQKKWKYLRYSNHIEKFDKNIFQFAKKKG